MKTLDAIYKKYTTERTPEVDAALCCRLEKLTGIVLRQFRIFKNNPQYEEFTQTGYLLFFELLDSFDPDKGKLEGYYMVSFKLHIVGMLKSLTIERKVGRALMGEDALDESTPYSNVLLVNLVDKLWDVTSNSERIVLGYLLVGESNLDNIAELEETTEEEIKWTMKYLRKKASKLFFEDGERIL